MAKNVIKKLTYQTMNQKTLDLIGIRHTVENAKEKLDARELGFDNIKETDHGLPGEDLDDVKTYIRRDRSLKTRLSDRSFSCY